MLKLSVEQRIDLFAGLVVAIRTGSPLVALWASRFLDAIEGRTRAHDCQWTQLCLFDPPAGVGSFPASE